MSLRPPEGNLPIVFREVGFSAGGVTILDGVSIELAAGPPSVIIGPNGSGKTTLLRIAMGLISPSRGRITWDAREAPPPVRRAIVFQRPVMLRRSVAGNIGYALAAAGIPRARRKARIAELLALVGLETLADRPARRLSGGEQQRLSLARALARDPEVLLLDEPTASLDPAATRAIEEIVLAANARGVKIVMATHDLGSARRLAGEIVMLHRGRVVESGPSKGFFASPKTDAAARFIAGELLV